MDLFLNNIKGVYMFGVNLAVETISVLSRDGYTVDDIAWIGTYTFKIPIHEFFDVARNTDYDNGYGGVVIPSDLLIVMSDGSWYSREEYDGSEWWEINRIPHKPELTNHLKVKRLCNPDYYTLVEACVHQDFKAV
jgi:hypothetical protein